MTSLLIFQDFTFFYLDRSAWYINQYIFQFKPQVHADIDDISQQSPVSSPKTYTTPFMWLFHFTVAAVFV